MASAKLDDVEIEEIFALMQSAQGDVKRLSKQSRKATQTLAQLADRLHGHGIGLQVQINMNYDTADGGTADDTCS